MTEYREEEYLQLSGLQHFAFCRRQWALIHLENQWAENLRTVEGDLFHARAHDGSLAEKRGGTLIVRGMAVSSSRLGLSGQCDVVEFHADPAGFPLRGRDGFWLALPVEYKRGSPKDTDEDKLQLCAQALCLEEMLLCTISEGYLFYGETRRRVCVAFTPELREQVAAMTAEMHQYSRRGHTPKAKPTKRCNACSLRGICLPSLARTPSANAYLRAHLAEEVDGS